LFIIIVIWHGNCTVLGVSRDAQALSRAWYRFGVEKSCETEKPTRVGLRAYGIWGLPVRGSWQ